MTVIISGTQGTSTPGLYSNSTFTGTYADGAVLDYTTGLGRISVGTSDGIAFYNAGVATTELMRLDSSGNLGLGVTPSAWQVAAGRKAIEVGSSGNGLYGYSNSNFNMSSGAYFNGTNWIYSGTDAPTYYNQSGGVHSWYRAPSGTAGSPITFTQAMTLGTSGGWNVLSFNGVATTTGSVGIFGGASGDNSLYLQSTDASIIFRRSGTEVGRFDSSGVLTVQNASASGGVQIIRSDMNSQSTSGQTSLYLGDTGSGIKAITREKNAVNTAYTRIYSEYGYGTHALGASFFNTVAYQGNNSTTWSTTSDERVKTNIRPISNALGKICALNAVHFEYKNALGKTKTSFIAQEFEQVLPGHVHEIPAPDDLKEFVGEDGMMKALDPELIPYLVAAIKEQQAIIESLRADVEQLKGQA